MKLRRKFRVPRVKRNHRCVRFADFPSICRINAMIEFFPKETDRMAKLAKIHRYN